MGLFTDTAFRAGALIGKETTAFTSYVDNWGSFENNPLYQALACNMPRGCYDYPRWVHPMVSLALQILSKRGTDPSFAPQVTESFFVPNLDHPLEKLVETNSLLYYYGALPLSVEPEEARRWLGIATEYCFRATDGVWQRGSFYYAFFPFLGRIRSSCRPNVKLVLRKNVLRVITLRWISAGEELCWAPHQLATLGVNRAYFTDTGGCGVESCGACCVQSDSWPLDEPDFCAGSENSNEHALKVANVARASRLRFDENRDFEEAVFQVRVEIQKGLRIAALRRKTNRNASLLRLAFAKHVQASEEDGATRGGSRNSEGAVEEGATSGGSRSCDAALRSREEEEDRWELQMLGLLLKHYFPLALEVGDADAVADAAIFFQDSLLRSWPRLPVESSAALELAVLIATETTSLHSALLAPPTTDDVRVDAVACTLADFFDVFGKQHVVRTAAPIPLFWISVPLFSRAVGLLVDQFLMDWVPRFRFLSIAHRFELRSRQVPLDAPLDCKELQEALRDPNKLLLPSPPRGCVAVYSLIRSVRQHFPPPGEEDDFFSGVLMPMTFSTLGSPTFEFSKNPYGFDDPE